MDTGVMLFGDYERRDNSPKRWSEPGYLWLDRSARDGVQEVRDKLDDWVTEYPEEGHADLISRFQSPDDIQHEGALFELTLHAVLKALGCAVELHPTVPCTDRAPDFLVDTPKGHSFYLEATVCRDESSDETAARKRLADIRDGLNRITSDRFIFSMRYQGTPGSPISARRIRERVERDLAQVDHEVMRSRLDQEGWDSLPSWKFDFDGFSLELTAIPRRPDKVGETFWGAIGMSMGGAKWLRTDASIRRALERKAGRYGQLPLPYVIAVNVIAEFEPDMIDVWNALLGREGLTIEMFDDGSRREREERQPNGLWTSKGGPQYTRVSAVMMSHSLRPWNLHGTSYLVHNPWARKPYDCELTALPQWVVREDSFQHVDGRTIGAVLGLPSEWPELD